MTAREAEAAFNPMDPRHLADAPARFAALRRREPVSAPLRGMRLVVRDDDVRAVLRDPSAFSSRANNTGADLCDADLTLSQHDPPQHTRLRRALTPLFSTGATGTVEPALRRHVGELVEALPATGPAELVAALVAPVPVRALAEFLGLDVAERAEFGAWCERFRTLVGREADPMWPRFGAALDAMLARRRGRGTSPGLLAALAADVGPLHDEEIHTLVHFLVVAGISNPRLFLGNLLMRMAEDPDRFDEVALHADGPRAAVEESLRLDGPAVWQMRTCPAGAEVGGATVAPGERVAVALASANRDEERWPEPDAFRLARPGAAGHVAFGHGPHLCLGAALTRLQGRVLLEELARFGVTFRVAPEFRMRRAGDLMSSGPAELPVVMGRRTG